MSAPQTNSPPHATLVRFYPRHGVAYKREKDHLALDGEERTFCGREVENYPKSSGTAMLDHFDAEASYSCKLCVAGLRRHGPVAMFERISVYSRGSWRVVRAPDL